MLKQILKDMYVDPDILAELPEEQKQILFFKIREEQIRRYVEKDKEFEKKSRKKAPKKKIDNGKKVRIMEDNNGQPWTWVMGEHPNDTPIDEIWENIGNDQHFVQKANGDKAPVSKVQALIHARNRRIENETESKNANNNNVTDSPNRSPDTPKKEVKTPVPETTPVKPPKPLLPSKPTTPSVPKPQKPAPPVRPQITPRTTTQRTTPRHPPPEPPPRIPQRAPVGPNAAQLEKAKGDKVPPPPLPARPPALNTPSKTESSDEENVYQAMDEFTDALPVKELEENEWQKQLRQYKAADERRKLHARRASMEVRRLSRTDLARGQKLTDLREQFQRRRSQRGQFPPVIENRPMLPPKPTNLRPKHPAIREGKAAKPSSRAEVVEWFKETQVTEILESVDDNNSLPEWFHGIISRNKAESLLENKKVGDFLIRVNEKIWGYALSYKDENKIKHFLIDGSEAGCYHFFGNDQIRHPGLEQLVAFHQDEAISYGGEYLKNGIGQVDLNNPDYSDLFDSLPTQGNTNTETRDTAL